MSEPFELERELQAAEKTLNKASGDYGKYALDAARKRAEFDISWATSLLQLKDAHKDAKITVDELKAMTTLAVQDALRAARIAEAMADASKRHLNAIEAQLSSIQSRCRLMQSQMNLR